jgi:RNA polymerase sigma-70 factor (ECF subfamily)
MTEKEYNRCVDLFADRLYRFIVKNLKHEEDAKDIVQTTFEILWKHRGEVACEKGRAYLFTVGYRNMIDHLRRRKHLSLAEGPVEDTAAGEAAPHDLKAVLAHALERLSDVQRSLLMLKDYEGYSYAEIAAITGLNASQVKVYLHRARLKMRAYLVKRENVI